MSNKPFKFKQFQITQEHTPMKVGTDSTLLGCLVQVKQARNILDIGTGTGLLALMMAQKSQAQIVALEINEMAFNEATLNVNASPWEERMTVVHTSVQAYIPPDDQLFDLIVSNPPYYPADAHYQIEDPQRGQARQTKDLDYPTFCKEVNRLLSLDGCCWFILPVQAIQQFLEHASESQLHVVEEIDIKPKPSKPANRKVLCISKQASIVKKSEVVIYEETGLPSEEYIALTYDFYLWKDIAK